MQDFRSLQVWRKAHSLALAVYKATASMPKEERFGLTQQMRSAAVSIAANISEGCGRHGDAEFARFLQMGMGSASELEYHILLASDLGFLDGATSEPLDAGVVEVKRMLASLIRRLRGSRG